jgi:hypothetical protein
MTERWRVAHLEELESDGRRTLIRRLFGIQAFGVSAWRGAAVGDRIIDDHDEVIEGHEELYLVLRGRAAFSVPRGSGRAGGDARVRASGDTAQCRRCRAGRMQGCSSVSPITPASSTTSRACSASPAVTRRRSTGSRAPSSSTEAGRIHARTTPTSTRSLRTRASRGSAPRARVLRKLRRSTSRYAAPGTPPTMSSRAPSGPLRTRRRVAGPTRTSVSWSRGTSPPGSASRAEPRRSTYTSSWPSCR